MTKSMKTPIKDATKSQSKFEQHKEEEEEDDYSDDKFDQTAGKTNGEKAESVPAILKDKNRIKINEQEEKKAGGFELPQDE